MKRFLVSVALRGVLFARKFAHLIPPRLLVAGARWIGYAISYFCPREMRIAEAQMRMAERRFPGLKIENKRLTVRRVFGHVGESIGEVFILKKMLEHHPVPGDIPRFTFVEVTGGEVTKRVVDEKRGALALSGHIGNFEIACGFHTLSGMPITVMGREPNYPELAEFVGDVRNSYGAKGIWRGGKRSAVALVEAVRRNGALALLIDQDVELENGFAPFFGLEAASPIRPLRLAVEHGLLIFTSFIVRVSPLRHHLFSEFIDYDPADPDAVSKVLTVYNERLQRIICEYPAQWLWWHRRWRRRPGSKEVRSTKDYIAWLDELAAGGSPTVS